MERTQPPSLPPSEGHWTIPQGLGGRHHMLAGDPTHMHGPPYMVRSWMGRRDVASLHRRHGAFSQSHTGLEGDAILQDNGIARATCSGGMPPPSRGWLPFSVCVGIWTRISPYSSVAISM